MKKLKDLFNNVIDSDGKMIDDNIESSIKSNKEDSNYNSFKKNFFEEYEKAKNDEIDLYSLDEDKLIMIYKLMQEEIKLVDESINNKCKKIEEIKAKKNNT